MAESVGPGGSRLPPAKLPEALAEVEAPELDESPGEDASAPMFHRPGAFGRGIDSLSGVRGCPHGLTGMCVFCPEFPCSALTQAVLQRLLKEHRGGG